MNDGDGKSSLDALMEEEHTAAWVVITMIYTGWQISETDMQDEGLHPGLQNYTMFEFL